MPGITPNLGFETVQNGQDSVSYAEEMIKRSGGDARAAFYLACKEKGADPNDIIKQIKGMSNPQEAFKNLLLSNPRAQALFSLFSSRK